MPIDGLNPVTTSDFELPPGRELRGNSAGRSRYQPSMTIVAFAASEKSM
jgi:hypothetical protein